MLNSEEELARAIRESEILAAENERLLRELREASEKYAAIRGSLSWKITGPLRKAADWVFAARQLLGKHGAEVVGPQPLNQENYLRWVKHYDTITETDRSAIRAGIARLTKRPLFSLLIVVRDPPADALRQTIQSIRRQIYREWEVCLVDDGSTAPHVARALSACGDDRRFRILRRGSRDGGAGKDAVAMSQGEFAAFLDAGDVLAETALFEVAAELDENPDAELIYSDEDALDARGERCDPRFKTGWNPDLLLERDYLGRLAVYRRELLFNLAITANRVRHIPAVLCHRGLEAAAFAAGPLPCPSFAGQGKVSVIIPTRDRAELLERCVEGLLQRTDYPALEVIVVDNDSREERTRQLFVEYQKLSNVLVLPFPGEFNWSAMNNAGARAATGEVLLFLNNDTDVVGAGWLWELAGHALRPEVGAVGAKLLFADGTVQHAGIWLGPAGRARHFLRLSDRNDPGYLEQLSRTRNLSAVTGACMAIRRTVFQEVGGFDESFPVSYSDLDLCLKLIQRGYRIVWTPRAELFHLESASRGSGEWRWRKEEADHKRFCARWEKEMNDDPFFNPNLDLIGEEKLALAFPPRRLRAWQR